MNAVQKELAYQASLAEQQSRWMKLSREDRERAEAVVIARIGRKFHIRDVLAAHDCITSGRAKVEEIAENLLPVGPDPCLGCSESCPLGQALGIRIRLPVRC